jgi:hypothetical protein
VFPQDPTVCVHAQPPTTPHNKAMADEPDASKTTNTPPTHHHHTPHRVRAGLPATPNGCVPAW